jgi:hypothetical protein
MGIIPEMRKKVCLGFALFSAELKQSRIRRQQAKIGTSSNKDASIKAAIRGVR